MEKLLQLLNEYEEKRIEKINSEWKLMLKLSFRPYTEESLTNKAYRSCWLEICSKYYWFIKRLVSNEQRRIDRSKVNFENIFYEYDWDITDEEKILILLSIQEKPVELLIDLLK